MFFIFFEQKFVYFRNNNFYQIFMYIHISYHQSKAYMLQIKLELNHTFKNKSRLFFRVTFIICEREFYDSWFGHFRS